MVYVRRLPSGQETFLKRVCAAAPQPGLDSLSGNATEAGENHVDLRLPCGPDTAGGCPFPPGIHIELSCEHRRMGMGLRLQARVLERIVSGTRLQLKNNLKSNLEVISIRHFRRVNVTTCVGFDRNRGSLAARRTDWQETLRRLQAGVPAVRLTEFQKVPLNLSGGGMRLMVAAPVELADLVLVFLFIGDKGCIIGLPTKVVWLGGGGNDGRRSAVLRFLTPLTEGQARIGRVATGLPKRRGQAVG